MCMVDREEEFFTGSLIHETSEPSLLILWGGDEDGRGDPESLCQAPDLSNVEFAFAGENF